MKLALLAPLSVVALAAVLFAAQEEPGMPPTPQPGEHHRLLERKAGTWDVTMTVPGMPGENKARYEARMDHGGLWLVGDYRGSFMGGPFSGHEICGWSSSKGKYVATWIDSMIDTPMAFEGDYDAATQTLSLWADGKDFATGKPIRERHDHRFVDADTWTFTMNHPGPDGAYAPVLTATYRRAR